MSLCLRVTRRVQAQRLSKKRIGLICATWKSQVLLSAASFLTTQYYARNRKPTFTYWALGLTLLVILLLPLCPRVPDSALRACVGVAVLVGGTIVSLLLLGRSEAQIECMEGSWIPKAICVSPQGKMTLLKVFSKIKENFVKLEKVYLKMKNFSLLINQLVFFFLCERVCNLKQPMVSFYTLMFFNVITYCVAYIKELIEREDWNLLVSVSKSSNVRHLAMSATRVALEWTKAVTFVITLVFLLLVFGLEKGLKNYSPSTPFLMLAGFYYILTEKVYVQLIAQVLEYLNMDYLESMESLYLPVALKGLQVVMSLALTATCALQGFCRVSLLASFTNVRARYTELEDENWKPLRRELIRLIEFRPARKEELQRHDDVCAICLSVMTCARVTPCRHLFHADCLRKCLTQATQKCPICKHKLPFDL